MQISYYSTFTKIQKLQNWKEKKKKEEVISLSADTPGTGQNKQVKV